MKYEDWKRVYVDKTISLKDWQNHRGRGKIGLASGKNATTEFEGTPPHLIGKLSVVNSATIKNTIENFEKQIVTKTVENAVIVTATGEIYHCEGGKNGIALKYFEQLGKKLYGATVTHNHPLGSDNEYTFSSDDFSLFENFNLSMLRGIDEKYVYELNHNLADIGTIDWAELEAAQEDRHVSVKLEAIGKGYGYRRWARD